MKRIYLLWFCLMVTVCSFGQLTYQQYDASSGFPTNQFYEVFEDSRGYIWALSDNGIYRFNGEEFERIEIDRSLRNSIPVDIIEDKRGIFILFLDGIIGCYNFPDRVIRPFKLNSELEKSHTPLNRAFNPQNVLNNSLRSVGDTAILFSSYYHGIILIDKEKVNTFLSKQSVSIAVRNVFGQNLFSTIYNAERESDNTIDFQGVEVDVFSSLKLKLGVGTNSLIIDKGSESFLSSHNHLLRFKNKNLVSLHTFKGHVNALDSTINGELLVHLNGAKTQVFDVNENTMEDWSVPFESISKTIIDKEGGRWISTLFDGIVYFPKSKGKVVKGTEDKFISGLINRGNLFYVGTPFNEILKLESNVESECVESITDVDVIHDFVEFDGTLLALTNLNVLNVDKYEKNRITQKTKVRVRDFLLNKDTLLLATTYGVFKWKNDSLWFNDVLYPENEALVSDKFNRITGLALLQQKVLATRKNLLFEFDVNRNEIDSVLYSAESAISNLVSLDHTVFFTTKRGLFSWEIRSEPNPRLLLNSPNFRINKLTFFRSNLYVCASNGLYQVDLKKGNDLKVSHLGRLVGAKKIDVQEVLFKSDKLFLGTTAGLYQIPFSEIKRKNQELNLFINNIKHGNKYISKREGQCFKYNQNTITIGTDLLVFNGRSDVSMYYRLRKDQEWIKTDKTEFEFPFLPHGEYTFQVKARSGSNWSDTQEYTFEIKPAFWQRNDVLIIFGFLLVGGVVLIFVLRIRKFYRDKEAEDQLNELNRKALELKQQALKAQINPHFMSNALSSIQSFIEQNDAKKSKQYLADFAHLMRLVLESSTERALEIEKEIKLLSSYVRLEQLRANCPFEFEVNCDDSLLDEGIKIPSMILQPLLENAILHGVSGVNDGKIILSFEDKEKVILCTIEDNGIGYLEHSKRKREREYKSRAMSIVKDRLEILNKNDELDKSIQFTDLSIEGRHGTRVKILLPVIY